MNIREKRSSYKDVKLAVYNIMKDERQFLDGWLANMSEADYIFLLDTGSTDGSYERAVEVAATDPSLMGKLYVKRSIIKPWTFDAARNENLNMIFDADMVDVILSVDLDERMEKGFADEMRKVAWDNPQARDFCYLYAWSHDEETKRPLRVIWYNKASFWMKGEIYYEYEVHETLTYSRKYLETYNAPSAWLNKNVVWLHHWPDRTKSRSSYLPLLEQRVKNHPTDLYGLFYYFRELEWYGRWEEAVKNAIWLYARLVVGRDDPMLFPSVCSEIARCFSTMEGKEKEVEFFYQRAIEYDPSFRDPYFFYAKWLAYHGRSMEAIDIMLEGKAKSRRHYDWRELSVVWEPWYEEQIRGIAKAWEGDYRAAYEIMYEAERRLLTANDKDEARRENFYADYEFIKNKSHLVPP